MIRLLGVCSLLSHFCSYPKESLPKRREAHDQRIQHNFVGCDFPMLWGHSLNVPPTMKACGKEPDIASPKGSREQKGSIHRHQWKNSWKDKQIICSENLEPANYEQLSCFRRRKSDGISIERNSTHHIDEFLDSMECSRERNKPSRA